MNPTYKQYAPRELYVPIPVPDTLEAENEYDLAYVGYRHTGSAFFDAFMSNLYHYGRYNASYHARLLGIEYPKLCVTILVLTGMTYTDFVDEYILLLADDLLKNRLKGSELKDVAQRLGFGSYSGFYHFMVSHRRWEKKRR